MEGRGMTQYVTHEADGIDFLCAVTFDETAGVASLIGAVVSVAALNAANKKKWPGEATVIDATTIRCIFEPWSLPPGHYSVQVRAAPDGYPDQTVADETFWVKPSASLPPA